MEKTTATVRLETFSDGVFAIVITLLAIDLKVPMEIQDVTNGNLWDNIKEAWPAYLAFAFSFFSILIMWLNHYTIFRVVSKVNSRIMLANGIILFFLAMVPFTTALLSNFFTTGAENTAAVVYSGLFVFINLAYNFLWYCVSKSETLKAVVADETLLSIRRTYLTGLPLYLFAFSIAFYSATLSLVVCIVLWIYWSLTTRKFLSIFKTSTI